MMLTNGQNRQQEHYTGELMRANDGDGKKEISNNTHSHTKSSDLNVCARGKKNKNSVASKTDEQQQWFGWMQAK